MPPVSEHPRCTQTKISKQRRTDMRKESIFPMILFLFALVFTAYPAALAQANGAGGPALKPPMAEKKTKTTNIHGEAIVDDYFWLREKTNPQVVAHLEAENAHTDAAMQPTAALQERLFKEMVG